MERPGGSKANGGTLILVEAAVETLEEALAAERAGADRIELCANLSDGGTTPGAGLIAAVVGQTKLPVVVMIRPRGGGFVYSDHEIGAMTRDIELAGAGGIAGIVTGVLAADGHIDIERTRALVSAAAGLPVTFHRAFDSTLNLPDALEQLIQIGISRVLTSGGAATALEGVATIAKLVDQARAWISIIAGGGIREHNARNVVARTGAREVHSRLVDEVSMKALVDVLKSIQSVSF
jgi:copper homeostasis protein